EEPWTLPMRDARQEDLVEVAQNVRERLSALGRRRGKLRARLSRPHLREHGKVADSLEVVRRPVDGRVAVLAERHFSSFSICFRRVASVRKADQWKGRGGTGRFPHSAVSPAVTSATS